MTQSGRFLHHLDFGCFSSGIAFLPPTAASLTQTIGTKNAGHEIYANPDHSANDGQTLKYSKATVAPTHDRTLAGTPATLLPGSTFLVTTAPAPTVECAPTLTPGRMVALVPMTAHLPTVTLPAKVAAG